MQMYTCGKKTPSIIINREKETQKGYFPVSRKVTRIEGNN